MAEFALDLVELPELRWRHGGRTDLYKLCVFLIQCRGEPHDNHLSMHNYKAGSIKIVHRYCFNLNCPQIGEASKIEAYPLPAILNYFNIQSAPSVI